MVDIALLFKILPYQRFIFTLELVYSFKNFLFLKGIIESFYHSFHLISFYFLRMLFNIKRLTNSFFFLLFVFVYFR